VLATPGEGNAGYVGSGLRFVLKVTKLALFDAIEIA
jgi:hypothetical protein